MTQENIYELQEALKGQGVKIEPKHYGSNYCAEITAGADDSLIHGSTIRDLIKWIDYGNAISFYVSTDVTEDGGRAIVTATITVI